MELIVKKQTLNEYERDIENETRMDLKQEVNSAMSYMDLKRSVKHLKRFMKNANGGQCTLSFRSFEQCVKSVKLPKLVIEKISGDISQWQTFQSNTTIENNPNLSKSEHCKFN